MFMLSGSSPTLIDVLLINFPDQTLTIFIKPMLALLILDALKQCKALQETNALSTIYDFDEMDVPLLTIPIQFPPLHVVEQDNRILMATISEPNVTPKQH